MSEEAEIGEPEPGKTEPERNPVTRKMLYRFNDGQQWTTDGIANALGNEIPNELAMRYYISAESATGNPPPGDLSRQIATSRRVCVRKCIDSMLREKMAEVIVRDGERFYKINASAKARQLKQIRFKQTEPSQTTWSGLTRPGVLDVITILGPNGITNRRLLEAIDRLFRTDIVSEYREVRRKMVERGEIRKLPEGTDEEITAEAKMFALTTVLQDLRAHSHVTLESQVLIKLVNNQTDQ